MKNICFILLIFSSLSVFSQNDDYINTDRPDQSEGTYTLLRGVFQLENGFTFYRNGFSDNLMARYGLLKGTEIRLESNFEKMKNQNFLVNDLIFSIKKKVFDENGFFPSFTLVGYSSYEFADNQVDTDICLAFENTLSEKFVLTYNIGSDNFFKRLLTTFQLGYSPNDKTYLFGEYYGYFAPHIKPSHNFDTGILYCMTKNFQVDSAIGFSLSEIKSTFFVTFGLSYRFIK